MTTCPFCKSSECRFSHRKNISERAASWVGIRAYRCPECQTRFWHIGHRLWDGSIGSLVLILMSELFLGLSVLLRRAMSFIVTLNQFSFFPSGAPKIPSTLRHGYQLRGIPAWSRNWKCRVKKHF